MTGGFSYHRRIRRVVGTLSGLEGDLLRSLAGQLVELLRHEAGATEPAEDPLEAMFDFSGPTTEPEDPVLARLLPTAYPGDAEAAAEFRRFTEGSLRHGKAAAATCLIDTLEEAGLPPEVTDTTLTIEVELDAETAMTWMRAFTDLRLALATRLGVEQDDEDYWLALPDTDPAYQGYGLYQWLGILQESLVEAVSESS